MFNKRSIVLSIVLLMVISGQAWSGTVSFDQLAVSGDLTVSKYNADLNTLYQKVNSNVQTDNIADDTLLEADMADEINPRIRTYEGASCEFVYDGLLPTETSGTLVGSVPAGTAYPRGYRVVKSSSTPKTWTASKWTFVDIDINGDLTYSEVAIDGATPSVASNSIRLARVSSDATEVNNVVDLRTTNCTSGPFEDIADTSTGATLEDMFQYGSPVRYGYADGYISGLQVSWDNATTFIVKSGVAHINGEYRFTSTDITVPQTADDSTNGVSGIDGSIAASTRYYVYAVADEDSTNTLSITYSSSTTPSGITNYREIGKIKTNSLSSFISGDILINHGFSEREYISGFIHMNGDSTIASMDSYNVTRIQDNGTGDYGIFWDIPFNTPYYAAPCMCYKNGAHCHCVTDANGAYDELSIVINTVDNVGTNVDATEIGLIAVGGRPQWVE